MASGIKWRYLTTRSIGLDLKNLRIHPASLGGEIYLLISRRKAMPDVQIEALDIDKEEEDQVIIGMANFTIKTCDDLFRAVLSAVPGVKVGVAMNEAAPMLTRCTGNERRLEELASRTALEIGASHAFIIFMRGAYPINVLSCIRNVPGVCTILGSTANPCQVIIGRTELGSAILGFVDGTQVKSIENEDGRSQRRDLVGKIGYPLG